MDYTVHGEESDMIERLSLHFTVTKDRISQASLNGRVSVLTPRVLQQVNAIKSIRAAEYIRLGHLNEINLLSHSCGGQKSKTREMPGLFPGESSLLGFQRATFRLYPQITSPVCMWKQRQKKRYSFSASSYKFLLFSHSVMSNSLQPRGLQHTMLPCRSPSPRTSSNSCPSSQ